MWLTHTMPARRFLTDAHRAEDVARPDRGGQPVVGVVGDPQRVLFVVERDDARDRPENLLARDPRGVVDVVEDRRLDEVAAVERARRWRGRRRSRASLRACRSPDTARTRSNCSRLTSAPIFVSRSSGRPDRDRARLLDHRVDETSCRSAAATRMRLPAEQTSPWLKKTPNSAPSTAASKSASAKKMFGDLPPSSSEIFFSVSAAPRMIVLPTSALPVNAILSTSAMLDDRRAGVSPAPVTMLTTPGGSPASAKLDASASDGQRRLLGRLQHRRAAGADRRRELPRRHQQRIVPRDDLPGDADRLAQREAHRVVGHRDDVAVNLRRQAAVVLEAGGDVGDVELGFDDRLAGVARLELGELVGARRGRSRRA